MPRGTYKTSRLDKERRREAHQSGDDFLKLAEQLNNNRNLRIPLRIHVSLGGFHQWNAHQDETIHDPIGRYARKGTLHRSFQPSNRRSPSTLRMIQRLMRSVIFLQNF